MQNITFITNVGPNTLNHLKLLLSSLQTNLDNDSHEILVYIDVDNEGVLDYLLSIKSQFKDLRIIKNQSPMPFPQLNQSLLTEYAKYDIVSYLQTDMVVGPHYDTNVLKHVKPGRILSSTRVEPPLHGESPVTIIKNFGLTPEEFSFTEWNKFSTSILRDELVNYFFAPITYYKDDWFRLGGYDTLFRRSREDSDFVQRCLHLGIELVQTFSANVYHFTCVSSRGVNWFDKNNTEAQRKVKLQQQADMIELKKFIRKWGTFNHGETKLHKLDIDLVAKNYSVGTIENIEPFFSRIWLSDENDRQSLLQRYKEYTDFANYLLNVSDKTWQQHKHLYHTEDYEKIFLVGEPTEFSIKVEIDFLKVETSNQFLNNLQNLYQLLIDCEPGVYEIDNVYITVNNTTTLPLVLVAENPKFDYNLLETF